MVMNMKSVLPAETACGTDNVKIQTGNTTGIQRKMRILKMKVIATLEIDEKKLAETDHSFEEEMNWAAQSGIFLKEYQEMDKCSGYEYAAFVWNTKEEKYVQVTRAVTTKILCRNRYKEYVKERNILPDCDTGNVVFRKRLVSTVCAKWEDIADGD